MNKNYRNPDINCLVVDDEEAARELLTRYIFRLPFLTLKGVCKSAVETIDFLSRQEIDLIFLDIQMDDIDGIKLATMLQDRVQVVFVTAHRRYALSGFEINALDYILKPVTFERLVSAVNKYLNNLSDGPETIGLEGNDFIIIREGKKNVKVLIRNILFIKSLDNYIDIILEGNKHIITLMSLSKIQHKLPASLFLRIHRSCLVNKHHMAEVKGNMFILSNKQALPIGKTYQAEIHARLREGRL